MVASLSLHWSVPTCFVKEHRSSANQPATCPFPVGLFFWKLPPPACPGTTCNSIAKLACYTVGVPCSRTASLAQLNKMFSGNQQKVCLESLDTPATNSALRGVPSPAPATNSALRGLQHAAPATNSALQRLKCRFPGRHSTLKHEMHISRHAQHLVNVEV